VASAPTLRVPLRPSSARFGSAPHEGTLTASAERLPWDEQREISAMAGSLNKVSLIGNLGKDPEIRSTQTGTKIVTITLATSDRWTDRVTGEVKENTEWHRVVIFGGGLADVAERYLRKGAKIGVFQLSFTLFRPHDVFGDLSYSLIY
jgi:hypothetical protein